MLPVAAFVALALGVLIVLRRAGRIVARTREVEGFRSSVRDLTARIDQSLEGATGRIDAVRRGQLGADTIGPTIEAATDAVARYADEAARSEGPAGGHPHPRRDRRGARACRAGARHGRPRGEDPGPGSSARAGGRGPDVDQARVPQPRPRPRCHRPSRRGRPRLEVQPPDQPAKGSAPASQLVPDHTM